MENFLGLLRINVIRGINLAKRDTVGSDPYVIVRMGKQFDDSIITNLTGFLDLNLQGRGGFKKLKTRVVKKDVNPEWNDELTLSVEDPNLPVRLQVYDRDIFTPDDKMGDADFNIMPFIEALKMNLGNVPSGTIITKIKPTRENCFAEESPIVWENGEVVQHMFLRLKNVESGEVELKLHWIKVPGSRAL